MLRTIIKAFGLICAALPAIAAAQPTVLVENVIVPVGTPSVNVEVSLDATAEQTASQWQVLYDDAFLTPDISATCPTPAVMGCSNPMPGVIQFVSGFFPAGGLPDFVGDIVFDLTGAPVGVYPLPIMGELHSDAGGAIPPDGSMGGSITIQTEPAPEYGSTPAPGSTIEFGTFTTADPPADEVVTIENVGNADGLDGACSITTNPNGAYSVDTGANYGPLAQMATAMRTVTCDTSILGDHDGGVLSCTHNGTVIPSPATYTLNCEVTPIPTYGSTPDPGGMLSMGGDQGDPDPTTSLLVDDDDGEMGSTLTGSCAMQGGSDPEITLPGGGNFSVVQGDPAQAIGLSCDATAQGTFNGTLECNAPSASNPGPHTYPVECIIGPPDAGMWGSTPPSGGTVELTPMGPVPVGTNLMDAGQLLVRNGGEPGDEDIVYTCSITGGSPEITQNPSPAMGTLVAGGADGVINYSCDTSAVGNFSATVQCDWTAPELEGIGDTELYTVTCDVRDPFSEVVEDPPSGTPQTAEVGPGESTTFSFLFEEVQDEGEAGEVSDCTLDTGTDFAITAPGSFPLTVPSGGMAQVDVTFNDPGMGDTFTDVLTCAIAHNPPPPATPPEGVDEFVSWPLEVTVTGRNATFLVSKNFDDDNPAEVEVTLSCNTGLPLEQTTTISEGDPVNFVIVDFEPGTMDCDVFETVPQGYAVVYDAELGAGGVAGNVFEDEDGCHYEGIESADFICDITNELQPVDVVVNKEWIDDNPDFQLPTLVEVTLRCNADIIGGFPCGGDECADQFIDPSNPGVFQVFPDWDGSTSCSVTEAPEAGVLQDTSDCDSIPLAPGVDGECTIVNTRLFAGIPTLSQYGLILLALLMLGIGAVAFRRYS